MPYLPEKDPSLRNAAARVQGSKCGKNLELVVDEPT